LKNIIYDLYVLNKVKKASIILPLIMLFTLAANAQVKTYVTLEAGPAWDLNKTQDPGGIFIRSSIPGSLGGIGIWQELSPYVSFSTGAYYHSYSGGVNLLDQRPHQARVESFDALFIPARLGLRIKSSAFPIGFTLISGYHLGFIMGDLQLNNYSSSLVDPLGGVVAYQVQESATTRSYVQLLEGSIKADYRFPNNWQLSFSVARFTGLAPVKNTTIDYSLNGGTSRQATYRNNGTRAQALFSLDIPVSNLWINKDYRAQRRIEHSSFRGKGVTKDHDFYFGADFGALWREFAASNPAIGASPMDHRGVFRYSNMHTGLFFGYMLTGSTGIDIGANFQRSSSFFALMYDHEVDLVNKERAPFYLEFPVSLRYFYNVYKKKVYIVPRMGASMIMHFAGADYLSGSLPFTYGNSAETVQYNAGRTARFGYIVHAGISAEYKIPIVFTSYAFVQTTYYHGLRDMDQIELVTSLNETPAVNTVTYRGSGWNTSIGIRIPILGGNKNCGANVPKREDY